MYYTHQNKNVIKKNHRIDDNNNYYHVLPHDWISGKLLIIFLILKTDFSNLNSFYK